MLFLQASPSELQISTSQNSCKFTLQSKAIIKDIKDDQGQLKQPQGHSFNCIMFKIKTSNLQITTNTTHGFLKMNQKIQLKVFLKEQTIKQIHAKLQVVWFSCTFDDQSYLQEKVKKLEFNEILLKIKKDQFQAIQQQKLIIPITIYRKNELNESFQEQHNEKIPLNLLELKSKKYSSLDMCGIFIFGLILGAITLSSLVQK